MAVKTEKTKAAKPAAKKTTVKKTAAKKTTAKKTTAKKTTSPQTAAAPKKSPVKAKKVEIKDELIDLCAQVAYDRKAENILLLDMRGIETAQSDFYLLCTGLSEPHIGAISELIQREARTKLAIRPILCNGDAHSHWIIIDYGRLIIHVMTPDAREKYQLEELWGDAPGTDVMAKLDREAQKRLKAAPKA